ncbi:MAG: radical SAM protein, partial [Actinobacteria bacterium]|nr:radical SAM protein [Actinomycetota bacterium]
MSTYELGRQPFGLASPAAWLRRAGAEVRCFDLAAEALDQEAIRSADIVAFYLPMHTATRIAAPLMERIKRLNPSAHLCAYGLYAPMNESLLRALGVSTVIGGEFEEALVDLVEGQREHTGRSGPVFPDDERRTAQHRRPHPVSVAGETVVSLGRQRFELPDRTGLPGLDQYAHVHVAPGDTRVVGYTEATRGCKHLCRHCPVVPVYGGRFRVVQHDVVIGDIAQQVEVGARHITFGDPDFLNAPGHAVALVRELHRRWPGLTYDVTIKVQHLLERPEVVGLLKDTGCLFVTSAIESIDDDVLRLLDKGHTRADLYRVVSLFENAALTLNPTFVTFTPWITLEGYRDLLSTVRELKLIPNVSPIQYAIRLLIPAGSKLLELPSVQQLIGDFDADALAYPWAHPDPHVDELHLEVLEVAGRAGDDRYATWESIWDLANDALGDGRKRLPRPGKAFAREVRQRATIPYLTE